MKIKKKAKRISSVVLCFLMLLTTLPMTAITANAAAQAYIKYIDTEVYIGDVLNIIVGVNSSTDETFTYQWQAKYPSLSWVNLSDKTDRPDSKFSGVFTDHLKFQTYAELVGPDSGWKDVVFRCKVTGSKSGTFYSGKCNFPGLLEKTEIPTIGFLGLEKPKQGKIPSTTATPINSTYYSFDYIEWYKYENNKVGRKLNDGEAFDSGMYCFMLLYWTGMRIGELLALTYEDIDLEKRIISISKSYQRLDGKDVITPPKTPKSNRKITIPPFLAEELKEYCSHLYGIMPNERMFRFTKSYMEHEIVRGIKETGVKRIRIHDLRHSHASLLVELGFQPLAIAERLGHEKIETTLNTYSHLYPNKQAELADRLELENEEDEL